MDYREAILSRLQAVLEGSPRIRSVYRNTIETSDSKFPQAIILDADEVADERDKERGRTGASPNLVTATPEIYITVDATAAKSVGPALNELRADLVKRILSDADLLRYCGPNGNIRYNGCQSAFAAGRTMQGQMILSISFTYFLRPSDL